MVGLKAFLLLFMQFIKSLLILSIVKFLMPLCAISQFSVKQIINIPWGTEKDYADAHICQSSSNSFVIAATITFNHLGKNTHDNIFKLLTLDGKNIFEFRPEKSQYLSLNSVYGSDVYSSNCRDIIYRLNISTKSIDSIKLSRNGILYIMRRRYSNQDVLVTTGSSGYVICEVPSLKILQTVRSTESLSGTGKPPISGSTMYCLMKKDELVAYSLTSSKTLWNVRPTPKAAKWLGITVGTFDDDFMSYGLSKDNSTIYATTMFGCVYKINAATGAIIKFVERFRGDANNAGLITDFSLSDVNGDGVEDLIGSAVDYNIYAISGKDLSVIWAYNTGYENQAGVSLYDITGDSVADVFSINDQMKFSVINGKTGAKILEHQIQPEKSQAKVILADINGNGLLDIFISGGSKAIRAYEMPSVKVPVGGIFWIPEG
jgi:hypothetical protein